MSCGCNSSNQSPCVPTPTVHLSNCEGCVYTVNSDCVIYNGDRLDFEPSTVINGSVRTLTTLMELFPTCNFHTDCIYFDGEPFSFEGELDEPYPSRTLTDLLNSIGLSITDIESDITTIQSDITTLQGSSGLQYFIESLDSVTNLHSLVPNNSAANASILIEPKGTGSFRLHSPSNAVGTNSVNLGRNAQTTGNWSFTSGYQSISGGSYSTSLGYQTYATGTRSTALGSDTQAHGPYSISTGANSSVESFGGEAGGLNSRSVYISERAFGYMANNLAVNTNTSDRIVYINTGHSNNQPFPIQFGRGTVLTLYLDNLKPQSYVTSGTHSNVLNYTNGVWFCELNLSLIVMTAQSGFNLYDSYYLKRMFTYKVVGGTASIVGSIETIGTDITTASMSTTTLSITVTVNNDLLMEVTPPSTLDASSNLLATGYVRMIQVL